MQKIKIIPNDNRLIVQPTEVQAGDILLPDNIKEKPQKGHVIDVGPGKDGKPMIAKRGDEVIYRRGAGTPLPDGYYGDLKGLLIMVEGADTFVTISNQ
jgi:chaperonin GroES